MAPDNVSRYELKSEIGRSNLGVVHLAFDPLFQRKIALRIVSEKWSLNLASRENILRWLKDVADLEHPAIVPIYDFGVQNQHIFIVSRYMPGGSLAQRLENQGYRQVDLIHLLRNIAPAIDYAQSRGIIHGDIRPSNILFEEDNAFITDFAFPRLPESTDVFSGGDPYPANPHYLSPEQVRGLPAQASSDIYSLGVIAFEVLTGHPPFQGKTSLDTAVQHINQPVPQVSDFQPGRPPEIQLVLEKALAKDAQARYSTAIEFGQAAVEAIALKSGAEPPAEVPQTSAEPPAQAPIPRIEPPASIPPASPIPPPRPPQPGAMPSSSPPPKESPAPAPSRPIQNGSKPVSPKPTGSPPRPKPPVVNTGFSLSDKPEYLLDPHIPLAPQTSYYFCLGVGEAQPHSTEITPTGLPESLPAGAELRVALFGFPGEIEIDPHASLGTLRLGEGGAASVEQQPGQNDLISNLPWLAFPVKTPAKTGQWRLRCSIYYKHFLVQSRLVTVDVKKHQLWRPWQVLKSTLDYNLTQSLSARHLSGMKPHRLSLMINDNGSGTHGFRFFGEQDFKSDAVLDGQELQNLIEYTRSGLRLAAWGDERPWKDQPYRYGGPPSLHRFSEDLVRLAVRGYRTYDQLVNRLAGGSVQARQLAEIMGESGLVQVALKKDARQVLPVAMIYDYPFDTAASPVDYQLCEQFLEALNSDQPLQECACFHGDCPSREDEITLCPSGFWGFRHDVGLPLSLAGAPDAPTTIFARRKLDLILSVCLDPEFVLRQGHEERLRGLFPEAIWKLAADRQTTFEVMQQAQSHLVYFYCHGGVNASNIPYIQIGRLSERGITRDNLRLKKIAWDDPRPLVFINGCHTAALEPESAFELVSGFIETAGAAGVIGTEITVFEPLATAFAESFLLAFGRGLEIGEAVRLARLALLKQMNPLGLAYIPFAMANLHLEYQR